MCKAQLSGVSELMELLHIDLEADGDPTTRRDDAACSKNVLRKQRNWQRQLAAKKSKRKEERQRRRFNRAQESGPHTEHQFTKRVLKAITRERLAEAQTTGLRLCVDLSMTDCMSDKEISRLAGQLRRLYGSNRRAARPFHLILTELREDSQLYRECVRMNDGFIKYSMEMTEQNCLDRFPPETVVYLTPDAEEALETVDADKVYVLGGLVDESIQKKLSLSRARELRVHTARLPIDEHMVKKTNAKNFHSKILAVNQVFDILLTFSETGSWTQALQACFPAGKGYVISPDGSTPLPAAAQTQDDDEECP
ncbi:tRNA methyltransferase 10 homolog B [Austrofundulus limnaeus]|uniref:tRNA methyltransferase 10 homolog B n=1 Tax=Austrofundulus limnaeus TaxID=52670 RepID=A0A2I4C1G9_AUSLI|nr:PREDICTED: tRNA methyltransferase 10 homolog B-like [Austrofundulus limnaeus]XP_013873848.1 PREDICTED: tRNA methyltransferase 10 homolog B-like [Austrofundulus limnaeus]